MNINKIMLNIFILCVIAKLTFAVPMQINYQGYLTDENNIPVNKTVQITFKLYDQDVGGNMLWSEVHENVVVEAGIYAVVLSNLTPDLFNGEPYLGVTIDNDDELSPRQKITSVIFAIKSHEAETIADGAVTQHKIAASAVTTDKIADHAVTTDKIVDGPGSGLNADVFDGIDSDRFALKDDFIAQRGQANGTVITAIAGEILKGAETPVPVYINKSGLIIEQSIGQSKTDIFGVNKYAQVFVTVVGTTEIKSISLKLELTGAPSGKIEVSIHQLSENDIPMSLHVDKAKISYIANEITNGWNNFIFEHPVSVDSLTKYAIVVSLPDGDADNNIKWIYSTSNIYNSGNYLESNNFGYDWTEVYACNASDNEKIDFIGFAISNANIGETISIQTCGVVTGFNTLATGNKYYLQNNTGIISTTPGKISKLIAIALNETDLVIFWSDSVNISNSDDAIAGVNDTTIMTPLKTKNAILANKPKIFIGKVESEEKLIKEEKQVWWSKEINLGFRPTYFKAIFRLYSTNKSTEYRTISNFILEGISNDLVTYLGVDISGEKGSFSNYFSPFGYTHNGTRYPPSYYIRNLSSLHIGNPFTLTSIVKNDNGLICNFSFRKYDYDRDYLLSYRIDNIIAW